VDWLSALLQDSRSPGDLAWATVYALGQLGDARALPILEQTVEHDTRKTKYGWSVANAARRARQWIQAAQW
jgi:HEAT repeat protein